MVMLDYRKLYLDVVADDGTVCIAYVTRLGLAGLVEHIAGYEVYAPDGGRRVIHGTGLARVAIDEAGVAIAFPTDGGEIAWTCRRATPPEDSRAAPRWEDHRPVRGLLWRLLVSRGEVQARGVAGVPGVLRGCGYSDWVALARPPRRLGLRRLQWGRVHAGGASLVFNRVTMATGDVWQTTWDGRHWSGDLDLVQQQDELAEVRAGGRVATLGSGRVLHAGAALDRERMPRRASRALAQALAGRMREVRALCRVELDGALGVALHEDVRLGSDVARCEGR